MKAVLVTTIVLFATQSMPAAYIFTGFAPASWGASDATLGITGLTIEDFEDVNLAPGLSIGVTTIGSGSYAPTTTLPATLAPVTQDTFGNVFDAGVWDGTRVVLNTGDNQTHNYSAANDWGDMTIQFSHTVTTLGFSFEQSELLTPISINGVLLGNLTTLAGLGTGSGRIGYIRINATGGDTIQTVLLNNGPGDGWVLDHMAFTSTDPAAIPEPATVATGMLCIGLAALGLRRRFQ